MSGQLRPLLGLRWTMVRSAQARWGFIGLAGVAVGLSLLAVLGGRLAPRGREVDVLLLSPSLFLAVAVVALLAPLVAGGGNELFPDEQLVAYPIAPRTWFTGSLALSPLNIAWTTQLIGLLAVTSYLSDGGAGLVLAVITCVMYLGLVTVSGQALGWLVVGIRQWPQGRVLTRVLAAAAAFVGLAVLATGNVSAVLDASPTTWVVIGLVDGAVGDYTGWAIVTAALGLATWSVFLAGRSWCQWSLRQPLQTGRAGSRDRRRRRPAGGPLREQLALDRSSIWRSTSLRRGLLVLGVLPGLAAAAAALDWSALVLLPGLVAAGAGLLFGVNAFCLDGPGALWLHSLPARPRTAFWAKTVVTGEVCLLAVVLTLLAGGLRVDGPSPTPPQGVALFSCTVVIVLRVVATCMRASVTRPHRADLRGPRDTPAPPGAMAAYSARLALSTTLVAVLFSAASTSSDWRFPALLAVPFVLLSARHILASARLWQDPAVRARVVHVVAAG
jgi:hypothetical protein